MSDAYPPPSEDRSAGEIADQLLVGNDPVAVGLLLQEMSRRFGNDPATLLEVMHERLAAWREGDPAVASAMLRLVHNACLGAGRTFIRSIPVTMLANLLDALPIGLANSNLLLHLMAMSGTSDSIETLVDRLSERPPSDPVEAAQVVSPLMQHDDWPLEAFFPAALDLIASPTLAAPVLDLANYLHRDRQVTPHPAISRLEMMNHLLGQVTTRLKRFEVDPRSMGDSVSTVSQRLAASVALAVSTADAVGLIGDGSSIPILEETVTLKHRRVQCEAAGALARFGEDAGTKRLIELTADPAARLRAIAYADELGHSDAVDPKFRSGESVAESEMALWLSGPTQMGVPPSSVETVHRQTLRWPGDERPTEVFLVRYEYNFGPAADGDGPTNYSNIGLAGPITFSFSADVADMPVEDILAMYAGWHAEHPDIVSIPPDQWNTAHQRQMASFRDYLSREDLEDLQPKLLGLMLDEVAGVFEARRDGVRRLVVTDGLETIERIIDGRPRPLAPEDLFNLFKGRKMLRTFNA